MRNTQQRITLKDIQQQLFRTQLILIIMLAAFLGAAGILLNFYFETQKRDQNLQNVATTIATSPMLSQAQGEDTGIVTAYLDSLQDSLSDIDVISVVDQNNIRIYHSNHSLIGSLYDGTIPQFDADTKGYYATNDRGPSGTQRRAYAAIYDSDGNSEGFVIAVMLMENIREQTGQTFLIYLLITLVSVLMELMVSSELTVKVKESLLGYEPDVFTAMYQIRDNILESLNEGMLAIDSQGTIQFVNHAAKAILKEENKLLAGQPLNALKSGELLQHALDGTEKEFNIQAKLDDVDILIDRLPIRENGVNIGTVGILHNRTEYTKLMEDLTGTRYLVDSMRANNHDFTNKLHVILGMIQMGMVDEAVSYIENISFVQKETISKVMRAVNEPSVAALLIGKISRAAELNIKFVLREGCFYSKSDMELPSETLVTIIGNLIDNAFEAINERKSSYSPEKELLFGIYSRPGAVLITADDTGVGIAPQDMERIFENAYSTKGDGRGTGLYQIKAMVDALGGSINVESQLGIGTSFSVSFSEKKGR